MERAQRGGESCREVNWVERMTEERGLDANVERSGVKIDRTGTDNTENEYGTEENE